jgi:opacity protein-like surface antigen
MGGLPTGDVTAASLFFNMYYDLVNASQIIPFVGGGLGISSVSVSDLLLAGNDANDEVFAFQFFAGLGYVANDRITLDLQYRYFGTEDPYYADLTKYDISSHNIMVGARFSY